MQPFSPFMIVILLGIGLILGVVAVLHQPGAPLVAQSANSTTAQVLEPLKVTDPTTLKLFNN